MSTSEYETVHTVEDYWDQPRTGVADYKGRPHYYRCIFDDATDDWSNHYFLKPLDGEVLNLYMETWEIWLRWEAAHGEGRASEKSRPALPQDKVRAAEIEAILSDRLVADPTADLKAEGEFKAIEYIRHDGCAAPHPKTWKVKWREVS